MPIDYRGFLSAQGVLPQSAPMPPAAAQAATDPNKLLTAIQIAQRIMAQKQAQASAGPLPEYAGTPLATLVARAHASPGVGQLPGTGQVPLQSQETGIISQAPPAPMPPPGPIDTAALIARLQQNAAGRGMPVPDVTGGQGQGAGPASLAATMPDQNTGSASSILGDVGNVAGSAVNIAGNVVSGARGLPGKAEDIVSGAWNGPHNPIKNTIIAAEHIGELPGMLNDTSSYTEGVGPVKKGIIDPVIAAAKFGFSQLPGSVQQELGTGAEWVMHATQYPSSHWGKPAFGDLLYYIAKEGNWESGQGVPDWLNGFVLSPESRAAIIAAHDAGGGTGVWENIIAKAGEGMKDNGFLGLLGYVMIHGVLDVGSDPLMIIPFLGEGIKAWAGARGAEEAAAGIGEASGTTKAGTFVGNVMTAPNDIPRAVLDTSGRVISKVGNILGENVRGMGKLGRTFTPEATVEDATNAAIDAANAKLAPTGIGADIGGGTGVMPPPTEADVAANRAAGVPPNGGAKIVSVVGDNVVYEEAGPDGNAIFRVRTKSGQEFTLPTEEQAINVASESGPVSPNAAESVSPAVIDRPTAPAASTAVDTGASPDLGAPTSQVEISPGVTLTQGQLPNGDRVIYVGSATDSPVRIRQGVDASGNPTIEIDYAHPDSYNPDRWTWTQKDRYVSNFFNPGAANDQQRVLQEAQATLNDVNRYRASVGNTSKVDPIQDQADLAAHHEWSSGHSYPDATDATSSTADVGPTAIPASVESSGLHPGEPDVAHYDTATPEGYAAYMADYQRWLDEQGVPSVPDAAAQPVEPAAPAPPIQEAAAPIEPPVAEAAPPVSPEAAPVVADIQAKADALVDQHIAPLQAVDPALVAQIKSEVEQELRQIAGQMHLPGRWRLDQQLDNAEAGALVRKAVADHGFNLPADAIPREAFPKNSTTVAARMQRILFNPDTAATKADREFLYVRRDLSKRPPAESTTQKILDAKLPATKILDNGEIAPRSGLVINDETLANLPESVRQNIGSARKVYDAPAPDGQYIGRRLLNEDLAPLSPVERQQVATAVREQHQIAFERYQQFTRLHGDLHLRIGTNPNRGFGIVDQGQARKANALLERGNGFLRPKLAQPLPEAAPVTERFNSELINARVAADELTAEQARTLETELPMPGRRLGVKGRPMETFDNRIDRYVMQGFDDQTAKLMATRDLVEYLHPSPQAKAALEKFMRGYDTLGTMMRQNISNNIISGPRSMITNAIQNAYTKLLTGHVDAIFDVMPMYRKIAAASDKMNPEIINEMHAFQAVAETGQKLPEELVLERKWKPKIAGHDPTQLSLVKQAEKIGGETYGKNLARITKVPAFVVQNKFIYELKNVTDLADRVSVFKDQYVKEIDAGVTRFKINLGQAARKDGMTADDYLTHIQQTAKERVEGAGGTWQGGFSPEDVKAATGDEQLTRTWRRYTREARNIANQEQKRIFFSYVQSPADKAVGKFVFFNYWTSRALALHTMTALRNPFVLAAYVRAWDGLERMAAQEGYPPGFTGFVRFMQSKDQFSYFFSPVNFFTAYSMLSDFNNDKAPIWQKAGLFLNPMVEAGLAAFGLTNNVPDITGTTAIRNAVTAVFNFADAEGIHIPGMSPDGKFTEDAVRGWEQKLYGAVNQAVQHFNPGIKTYGPYRATDSQIAQVKMAIVQNAIAEFGPQASWTPDQQKEVDAALGAVPLTMDANPRANAAYKSVAEAQLVNKAINLAAPVQVSYDPLVADRATNNAIPYGTDPSLLTPEQIAAQQSMGLVNSGTATGQTANTKDTTDLSLTAGQDAYSKIGTPRQQALYSMYYDILDGTLADVTDGKLAGKAIMIGKVAYPMSQVVGMDPADRQMLADHFLQDQNGQSEFDDYTAKRKAFLAANPQVADLKSYQKVVYADPSGVRGWRTQYAKENPNFAREMAHQEKIIRQSETNNVLVQKALDQWAAGRGGYEAANGIMSGMYDSSPTDLSSSTTVAAPIGSPTTSGSSNATGSSASTKASTVDTLTNDIAAYQQNTAVLNDAMAKAGLPGGIQNYTANKYMANYINNVFGDLIPSKSGLQQQYETWAQNQQPGSDTSPAAFAPFYDTINPPQIAPKKIPGWSEKKTKLYYAWVTHQPVGSDSSPGAFDKYLLTLSTQTVPGYPAYAP